MTQFFLLSFSPQKQSDTELKKVSSRSENPLEEAFRQTNKIMQQQLVQMSIWSTHCQDIHEPSQGPSFESFSHIILV